MLKSAPYLSRLHNVKSNVSLSSQDLFDVLARHKVPFLFKSMTSKAGKFKKALLTVYLYIFLHAYKRKYLHKNSGMSSKATELLLVMEQLLKTSKLSQKSSFSKMSSFSQ